MNVLLSIKPKFVEKIISGEKKYEFRRTIFKNDELMAFLDKPRINSKSRGPRQMTRLAATSIGVAAETGIKDHFYAY